jgi:cytochrome c-type biogenesis protein CcmH/NrfG
MAVGCLFLGVVIGYLFRGSESAKTPVAAAPTAAQPSMRQMPTMEQMKSMADKQAMPLLEKLKADPNNAELLAQVGAVYKLTHQFNEAQDYYKKSLKANPKNNVVRGDLAACLYYTGDNDGAIEQLQEALRNAPNDPNSLFNLGLIRWQGKKDRSGAVAAWRQLLKSNPKLDDGKKGEVEKMIAEANQSSIQ